jgi:hypothetical protein
LTLEALLPAVSRGKVHGRTGWKESRKGGGREEGEDVRKEGRKQRKNAYLSRRHPPHLPQRCHYPHPIQCPQSMSVSIAGVGLAMDGWVMAWVAVGT